MSKLDTKCRLAEERRGGVVGATTYCKVTETTSEREAVCVLHESKVPSYKRVPNWGANSCEVQRANEGQRRPKRVKAKHARTLSTLSHLR